MGCPRDRLSCTRPRRVVLDSSYAWGKDQVRHTLVTAVQDRIGGTFSIDELDYRFWRGEVRLREIAWTSATGIMSGRAREAAIGLHVRSAGTIEAELDAGDGILEGHLSFGKASLDELELGPARTHARIGPTSAELMQSHLEKGSSSWMTGTIQIASYAPFTAQATLSHAIEGSLVGELSIEGELGETLHLDYRADVRDVGLLSARFADLPLQGSINIVGAIEGPWNVPRSEMST